MGNEHGSAKLMEARWEIVGVNNHKIVNATKWSSVAEISSKLVSPITNAVLARLLVPSAFGAVATINLIISFAEIFTDAGFQKYIIQHEFESEENLNKSTNVAFWTNFIFSTILWILIILFRNPLATLAGNCELGTGVAVAGFAMILVSFSSIQSARFKRYLDFKSLFIVRLVTSFTPLLMTIPLAIALRNYWALILGSLFAKLIEAIILLVKSNWKPRLSYSLSLLKEMLSFSMWTMLESISIWLTSCIGVFIVGNLLNEYYLGIYQTSITTVNAYMAIITSATMPVLFSSLSRLQNDEEKYIETLNSFQKWISYIVIPMSIGLFLYRDFVTDVLLGSQWEEASLFVGMWSLTSGLTIVYSHICSEVYRSKGKPRVSLFAQTLHLLCLIPIIYFAARESFVVLVLARSLIRIQGIIVHAILLKCVFKISFIKMLLNTLPSIAVSCLMSVISVGLQQISDSILWTVFSILICIVFYLIVMLGIPSVRKDVLLITQSVNAVHSLLKSIDMKLNKVFHK